MVHRQEKGKIIKVFSFTVPNDEHEVSEGCVADVFQHAHDPALISPWQIHGQTGISKFWLCKTICKAL